MKKLLILLLVSLCVIGYRSPDIVNALGLVRAAPEQPASPLPFVHTLQSVRSLQAAATAQHQPMSPEQLLELSKKDQRAYQKFLQSRRVEEERSAVDKLMNFLARGKFE